MTVVVLEEALEVARFGGKAVALGAARRAALPVPPGFAISASALARLATGDLGTLAAVRALAGPMASPLAVRSSAVGEDGRSTSFAGQHRSYLNVSNDATLIEALIGVYASARSDAVLGYRARLGVAGDIAIGAVVQQLVDPRCAGVLFTRHPLTGADERVIEASWGLGQSVVAGLVTPDQHRLSRRGELLETRIGDKDTAVRRAADGGTCQEPVAPELVVAPCLDARWLRELHLLALRCEEHFGRALDLEWALAGEQLYLLQSRPIPTGRP